MLCVKNFAQNRPLYPEFALQGGEGGKVDYALHSMYFTQSTLGGGG